MDSSSAPNDSPDPSANILFIDNLHKDVSDKMIIQILEKGLPDCRDSVISAAMAPSTDPTCVANDTRGCFVQFLDSHSANRGMQFINGREFFQKKVKVSWAIQNPSGGDPKILGTSVSIYAGDLDEDIDDMTLKKFFEPCGEVLNAKVVRDPSTGQSKGFGFVAFTSKQDAENAIQTMNGTLIGKKHIKTNWASRNKATASRISTLNYDDVLKAASPENCTVYVGSIPMEVNQDQVHAFFCQYGDVVDTKVFVDKGFAFIKFAEHESAANAITKADGGHMCGAILKCWWGKDENNEPNFRSNSSKNYNNQHQPKFSQPQFTPIEQTSSDQMHANMTQEEQMEYMRKNPAVYQQYMAEWMKYVQYQQYQQAAMNQQYQQQMYYQQMQQAQMTQAQMTQAQMQQAQIPQGQPQIPQGQPQIPQGQPQVQQAQPQIPQGQPPIPQGQPQIPQGQPQIQQQLPHMQQHPPHMQQLVGYQHGYQNVQ